jgi:hypothetical protein
VPVKSVDDLKSLMRRFVDEVKSEGDEAVADELLADTFKITPHRPECPRTSRV